MKIYNKSVLFFYRIKIFLIKLHIFPIKNLHKIIHESENLLKTETNNTKKTLQEKMKFL